MDGGEHKPASAARLDLFRERLSAARGGDRAALNELYLHYRPDVIAYVSRGMGPLARRWSDPEDIAEDALFAIVGRAEHLPDDATEASLRARLLRTAGNRIKDHIRKFRSHEGISTVPEGGTELATEQHSVSRREARSVLRGLVERLPDEYRDIVRLCGLEELSYVEVASRLDLHPDTVRKRYERARQALAKKLAARGYVD